MTDQELIQALHEHAEWAHANEWETPIALGDNLDDAADRLEALLAENELYYREVARLKAECDHFRDLTKKMWCDKRYGESMNAPTTWRPASDPPKEYRNEDRQLKCFLVCEDETGEPFRAFYDGEKWGDGLWIVDVRWWMPLPEPPRVENCYRRC